MHIEKGIPTWPEFKQLRLFARFEGTDHLTIHTRGTSINLQTLEVFAAACGLRLVRSLDPEESTLAVEEPRGKVLMQHWRDQLDEPPLESDNSLENISPTSRLGRLGSRLMAEVIEFVHESHIRVLQPSEESMEHLRQAAWYVNTGGSVVMYWGPHRKTYDPLVVQQFYEKYMANILHDHRFAWAASARFVEDDLYRSLSPLGPGGIISMGARSWIPKHMDDIFSVVQEHYLELMQDTFDLDIANNRNLSEFRRMKHFANAPSTILAVSPEGHRNREYPGFLRSASGWPSLMKRSAAIGLPVVFEQVDAYTFVPHVRPLISYKEAQKLQNDSKWNNEESEFAIADALMMHLLEQSESQLTIVKNGHDPRGVYARGNIVRVG